MKTILPHVLYSTGSLSVAMIVSSNEALNLLESLDILERCLIGIGNIFIAYNSYLPDAHEEKMHA